MSNVNQASLKSAVVCGGVRIPFVKSSTHYLQSTDQDMLTFTLQALTDRFSLHGKKLDEVVCGAVSRHPRENALARESVLGTSLHPHTPAFDLSRACGTSLEASIAVANKIALQQIEVGIAGGADTNSDLPLTLSRKAVQALLKFRGAKSIGQRLASLSDLRPSDLLPNIPSITEARTGLSMGEHCERMAKEWKIERSAQDEIALASHKNAASAYEAGFFSDLVVEYEHIKKDAFVRSDTSLQKLASLKPVFDTSPQGTLTAGNSSPLTDGAAAVLIASEDYASKNKLPILARFVDAQAAAVDFVRGEGLLMAPTIAVAKLLQRQKLTLQDFDYYEIHEAFAAQVLCTLRAWESLAYCKDKLGLSQPLGSIDRAKLNVHGSSLALGHPFAATGARIVATAAKLLSEKQNSRCLISICTAGGQGVAAILESV